MCLVLRFSILLRLLKSPRKIGAFWCNSGVSEHMVAVWCTYNFWLIDHHCTFLAKRPQARLNFLFLFFELGWVQSESPRILSFLCLDYRHVEMSGSFAQTRYNVIDTYIDIFGVLSLWSSTFSNICCTLRTSPTIFVHFPTGIFLNNSLYSNHKIFK